MVNILHSISLKTSFIITFFYNDSNSSKIFITDELRIGFGLFLVLCSLIIYFISKRYFRTAKLKKKFDMKRLKLEKTRTYFGVVSIFILGIIIFLVTLVKIIF